MPKRIAAFSLFCLASAVNGKDRIPAAVDSFVSEYCLECHDSGSEKGDLNLEAVLDGRFSAHADSWENVVRRLSARQMPPKDERRPDEEGYQTAQAELEALLDKLPVNPGRTPTFRRLTRVEYKNAIRDLLALDIDPSRWLPKDEAGHGFDNITVGDLSPTLLNRYVAVAQEISRMAVGRTDGAEGRTIRIRPDITQEAHREGLPFGTRGGALIEHTFPQTGEYEIEVRLARDRNEHVEGLRGAQQLEILLDRKPVGSIPIGRPDGSDHSKVDANLKLRLPVAAGPRKLGITFRYSSRSVLETKRQPYEARYNFHRHPRQTPAVFQISITGPFGSGELAQTPSRERIFGKGDESKSSEARATEILSRLIRRAYRRPVMF